MRYDNEIRYGKKKYHSILYVYGLHIYFFAQMKNSISQDIYK